MKSVKMKILHALFSFNIGGTETMLVDIVNEQVKTASVYLLIINNSYLETLINKIDRRVRIIFINRPETSVNPIYIIKANIITWIINPDIIHTHDHKMRQVLRLRRNAPLVFTKHSALNNGTHWNLVDYCYGISKAALSSAKLMGAKSGCVVYNGIHPEMVKQKLTQWHEGQPLRILSVGRIEEEKGQHLVIEAFKKIKELKYNDITVDIIGEGSKRKILETKVEEYGIGQFVHFLGLKDRKYVYSHICDYDLFLQSSISEGFGLTIAEAMAAKVPVLTSDQDGSLEVLDGGRLGITFTTGNIDDLVHKILQFRNGLYTVNTEEAFLYVCDNFDIKHTAKRYIDEYLKLINN